MTAEFRKILDQLMGKDRNKLPAERQRDADKVDLRDRKLCPFYLVDYCPHELFTNTKSDLGPCPREHDEHAKRKFDALTLKDQWAYGFHTEMQRYIDGLIATMDAKIRRGERRAAEEMAMPDAPAGVDAATHAAQVEQVEAIERRIQELMSQMDKLAEEGEVDALDGMVAKVDRLKAEKDELTRAAAPGQGGSKVMRVCDICGAFLVSSDTEKRIQAHLEGKLHIGFWTLRETSKKLEKLRVEVSAASSSSSSSSGAERSSRRSPERERSSRRSPDRDRRRKRSRSRSRSRGRSDRRERDRDREHSSRSSRRSRSSDRSRHSESSKREKVASSSSAAPASEPEPGEIPM